MDTQLWRTVRRTSTRRIAAVRPPSDRSLPRVGARRRSRLLVPLFLALSLPAVVAAPAWALTLTTPYPAITVQPGQTSTLDLEVGDAGTARVDLSIPTVPSGWTLSLRGGGKEVSAVYADPDSSPRVELRVEVPSDAAKGDYRALVRATMADGSFADLPLTLRVAETAALGTSLDTDFTALRGPSDAVFRYTIELKNGSPEERSYNIAAQGPEGWKVVLKPSGAERETPSVSVQGDGTQRLSLEVTPASGTPAASYPVLVTAGGGGEEVSLELAVEITGTFDLTLTTPDQRLNAEIKGGGTTRVPMLVTNDGTGPLQSVSFTATPPVDWKVTFEPESVDTIGAGESVPVTAVFTPAEGAIAGDYVVSLSARADQAIANTDLRVTVKASTWWGIFGIALIAVALGGLLLVFRVWGHR